MAAIGLIILAYVPKNIYSVELLLIFICSMKIATSVGYHVSHFSILYRSEVKREN